MQIRSNTLPFFFLPADGCIQEDLLLFFLHFLELHLVADNPSLVKYNKNHQANGQYQHTQCPEEQNSRYAGSIKLVIIDL